MKISLVKILPLLFVLVGTGCASEAQKRYKAEELETNRLLTEVLDSGGACVYSSERFASYDMVMNNYEIKKYVDGMWVVSQFDGKFLTVYFDYSDMVKFDPSKHLGVMTKNEKYLFARNEKDGDFNVYTLGNYQDSCGFMFKPEDVSGLTISRERIDKFKSINTIAVAP